MSANLGEHHRHVPRAVAMQMAPIVVPRMNCHQQKCNDTTIEKYIMRRDVLLSERPELCPTGRVVDLVERRGRVDRRAARTRALLWRVKDERLFPTDGFYPLPRAWRQEIYSADR